jgi:hypothetical protein
MRSSSSACALAIEQRAHLLQAEAVLLDGEGGLDRVDTVLAATWQSKAGVSVSGGA